MTQKSDSGNLPVARSRDLGDPADLCAWELARGLARALLKVSYNSAGRCWCKRGQAAGFHTAVCTAAQAELAAARLMLGDTRRPATTGQANGVTD